MLYEAIPVWERAYAVSETKRSVEGAAGTRGADKVTSPSGALVKLAGCHFVTLPASITFSGNHQLTVVSSLLPHALLADTPYISE